MCFTQGNDIMNIIQNTDPIQSKWTSKNKQNLPHFVKTYITWLIKD